MTHVPSSAEGGLAYVLTPRGRALECSVRWTRLMKWEAFSEADLSDLKILFTKRYAASLVAEDRIILPGLMQFVRRPGQWPALEGEYGYELLVKLLATRRAFYAYGNHRRLNWDAAPVEASLRWEPALGAPGEWETSVALPSGFAAFAFDPPVCIHGESSSCRPLATGQPSLLTMRWLASRRLKTPDVSGFCLRLAKEFPEATFPTPDWARLKESESVRPLALLTVQQRAVTDKRDRDALWIDLRDRLRLRVRFQYGKAVVAWDAAESAVSYREEGAIIRVARDRDWEKRMLASLAEWGFSAEAEHGDLDLFNFDSSTFSLREGFRWGKVLDSVFPSLDAACWRVETATGLRITTVTEPDLQAEIREEGGDQFGLSFDVVAEGRRAPLLPILRQALKNRAASGFHASLAWLREGSFALRIESAETGSVWLAALPSDRLVEIADQLYELFDRNPFDANARARVSRWRLGELASARLIDASCAEGVSAVVRVCERIGRGIDIRERAAPKNLNTQLRSYQRMGIGWLAALDEVGAGGVLADDMGLGKTIQTIAHLLDLKQHGRLSEGALIVAPTSVIDNWAEEIRRYAPSLSVVRFHGKDRSQAWASLSGSDVVLTTYALLRLESERLASRHWTLAILDEAQYIKNASSRTAEAARGLRALRKLCLTGTPIENRLEDIWSLFEFLLPGFLGEENTFRARIAQPLKDAPDSGFALELRGRLKRRLAPFTLRRTKAEVLSDLPEKTEVVLAVSMDGPQRDLYESYLQGAREEISLSMATGGIAAARMLILSRLLRLRQICCDPRLIEEERSAFSPQDAAKLEALRELIQQLMAQGSRILVFSQFTSMLTLIGSALREDGIEFLELTGSTPDRAERVQAFQDGDAPVFLISLRAGGAGLNLTAADCVIHFDPWWNPAVERQASDRVHRIGQSKPVFIYKLIVDDSIESRIQRLQRDKLALVEGLLSEGNIDRLSIDQESIEYLFGD